MLLSDGGRFEVTSMRQRILRPRTGEAGSLYQAAPMKLHTVDGEEIREANRRRQLRDLVLESSPNATLAVDLDGVVTLANGAARAQFGLSSHDLGRPFRDLEVSYRPTELRSLI